MRSRQGWVCERILCLITCGELSLPGEGCRTGKLLRCQADKSSWTMVPGPLWVKSGHVRRTRSCLLYTRKRRRAVQLGMSALGQERTLATLVLVLNIAGVPINLQTLDKRIVHGNYVRCYRTIISFHFSKLEALVV